MVLVSHSQLELVTTSAPETCTVTCNVKVHHTYCYDVYIVDISKAFLCHCEEPYHVLYNAVFGILEKVMHMFTI